MNIFGHVGKFIMDNQETFQWVAVILVVVLLLFVIYKIIKAIRKNAENIEKICQTLDKINDEMKDFNTHGDLIYIDNCMTKEKEETVPKENTSKDKCEEDRENNKVELTQEEIVEKLKAVSEKKPGEKISDDQEEGFKDSNTIEKTFSKFLSRDEAVNKYGKSYTVEELEKQIKE